MTVVEVALVGLFALAFGSFATVLGTRVPAGEAITGRSRCRHCQTQLAARDNIPVLTFLVYRGRCRHCGARYGSHYLIAELAAPCFALITWFSIDDLIIRIGWLALAVLAAALIVSDLTLHRLPNRLVLAAAIAGATTVIASTISTRDYDALLRAMTGSIALFLLYLALNVLSRGGMGAGDVKLAGALGLYLAHLSWAHLYWATSIAFILGGVVGAVLLLFRRADRKTAVAFGPFMLVGAFAVLPLL